MTNMEGMYLSDFMALPFAWGLSRDKKTAPQYVFSEPGIILRISFDKLDKKYFRPAEWFLAGHLQRIQHQEFVKYSQGCYKHKETDDRNTCLCSMASPYRNQDSFRHLWRDSLKETGEFLYYGKIPINAFEVRQAPPLTEELMHFSRWESNHSDNRSKHLKVLNELFSRNDYEL